MDLRGRRPSRRAPGHVCRTDREDPYLQSLGITAELLPVFDFDDSITALNAAGERITLGYSPVGFFSPHAGYCVDGGTAHANEFRDLVKALHKAGIEVILDVVFNHTDEGNEFGPTYVPRHRQLDLPADPGNPASYLNYSGCGNTFNANHPLPQSSSSTACQCWVEEMHVDGFRFDEDRFSRGARPAHRCCILGHLADRTRRILADTKMIAEAWDAAAYAGGTFPWRPMVRTGTDAIRTTCGGSSGDAEWPAMAARMAAAPTSTKRVGRRRTTASTS